MVPLIEVLALKQFHEEPGYSEADNKEEDIEKNYPALSPIGHLAFIASASPTALSTQVRVNVAEGSRYRHSRGAPEVSAR